MLLFGWVLVLVGFGVDGGVFGEVVELLVLGVWDLV